MISLENVSAGYNGRDILSGITISVHAGDLIALIGPNGSGKSTLIKLMAGQLATSVGSVRLGDIPVSALAPRQRGQRIAYFPQSRPTPNMDVYTLVMHGRFPRLGFLNVMSAADRKAVQSAMEQTGVADFARRPLASLSGGERQRAYLAMLIAQDTEILLLDEPGSFLDIRHQIEVMDILRALNARGKTILFAAHDIPLAFSYAKRVVLLDKGKLAGDAPAELMADSLSIERAFGVRIKRQSGDFLFRYSLISAGAESGYTTPDMFSQ